MIVLIRFGLMIISKLFRKNAWKINRNRTITIKIILVLGIEKYSFLPQFSLNQEFLINLSSWRSK